MEEKSALVELVQAWETYAAANAEPSVVGFCQQWLARHKAANGAAGALYRQNPPGSSLALFGKMIGRLGAMQEAYTKLALKSIPGSEPMHFYVLNLLNHLGEARKTDLIAANFLEQTTGIDLLNRLLRDGYLAERPDPADGRARLLTLTPQGHAYLGQLAPHVGLPVHFLYRGLEEGERALIVSMLAQIELRHEKILSRGRNTSFMELMDQELGEGSAAALLEAQQKAMAAFLEARSRMHEG